MQNPGLATAGLQDGRLIHQMVAYSQRDSLRAIGDVKFGQDATDVGLDG